MINNKINNQNLLALFCADVEIKLLKESDQETYKDKLYTSNEIIKQLQKSMFDLLSILENNKYNYDK